jgi:DNA-binding NarL/FixJ family response regulator
LPGLSGIEAISIYKKLYPEVLIIILTIFDDDERVFDAIKAGADGYLLKRTPGTEIVNGMKQVLKGGASISPPIAKKMMRMLANPSKENKKESILTDRETIILKYLIDGLTINAIAEKLIISRHTVDTHTKNIYKKLHVHNRSNLVATAIKKGLI